MKTRNVLSSIIHLALTGLVAAYAATVTVKWVKAEKRASWLEGQWSVYEGMADQNPKTLRKW